MKTLTKKQMQEHVLFLRARLIPDLRASGQSETANDLEKCCRIIQQLKNEQADALDELVKINKLIGKNIVDAWEDNLEETRTVAILENFSKKSDKGEGDEMRYNEWAVKLGLLIQKMSGNKPENKPVRFARKCDVTGEGMNKGYCFGEGEGYAKTKKSAHILAKKRGYKTLAEAYEDGAYYYTEWEENDYQYEIKNGKLVEVD